MTLKSCITCDGTGWVCGCTLTKPWEGEGSCGCGESGKNCLCNKSGDFSDDYKVTHSRNKNEITVVH